MAKRNVPKVPAQPVASDASDFFQAEKGDLVLFRSQDSGDRHSYFIFGLVEEVDVNGEAKTVRVSSLYCADTVYPIKLQKWVFPASRCKNLAAFVRHAPNFLSFGEAQAYAKQHLVK